MLLNSLPYNIVYAIPIFHFNLEIFQKNIYWCYFHQGPTENQQRPELSAADVVVQF